MSERLFAAVLPPDPALDALEGVVGPRRDTVWRWVPRESWHVTLAFYGSVDADRYEPLVARLRAAAARTAGFPLALDGVGAFPHAAAAKALWAAVEDPTGSLAPLAGRCRTAASVAGVQVDGRGFVGHLTLARSSRGRDATRWLRALAGVATDPWPVTEVALVRSHLGAGGARHEVRERLPLGDA